jgi:hypothetical protein
MKKLIVTIVLVLVELLAGCESNALLSTNFEGHVIRAGQSSSLVKDLLGPPDLVYSMRPDMMTSFSYTTEFYQRSQAFHINFWGSGVAVPSGIQTVEWTYRGQPNSLILWFNYDQVTQMWVTKTSNLKRY